MAFLNSTESQKVVSIGNADPAEVINAQYPQGPDDDTLIAPDTQEDESMEYVEYDEAEDSTATMTAPAPTQPRVAKRRQGVSRMLAEAVANNPGLTQSEYQRALGIKSPIATMAKRLTERGIITAKQDGRYVRYYPGKREFTEARVGRKPVSRTAAKSKPQQTAEPQGWQQPKGWNILTITRSDGSNQRYVRLDENWYELVPTNAPRF